MQHVSTNARRRGISVLLAVFWALWFSTCGSSVKGPLYLRIRDIRYSQQLHIEFIEPRGEATTSEEFIDVQARIRDPQARVVAFFNGESIPIEGPDPTTGDIFIRHLSLRMGENDVVLTARKNTLSNEVRFSIKRAPESKIKIVSPSDGSLVQDRWITVRGEADPQLKNLQVGKIAAKRESEKSPAFVAEGVIVPDGASVVVATGVDEEGETWRATARVLRDLEPPQIVLDSPPKDASTNEQEVLFEGVVNEKGATLTLNGQPLPLDEAGKFRTTLPLIGLEERFELVAQDSAGNETKEVRIVKFDTERPGLKILEPKGGVLVSQLPFALKIFSSKVPATVQALVDDLPVAEVRVETAQFPLTIPEMDIPDGSHKLVLRLTDSAGNKAEQLLSFASDLKPPVAEVRGVSAGMTTERARIDVEVSDPNLDRSSLRVTLNGKPFQSGQSLDYRTHGEGDRLLRIEARDRFGHSLVQEIPFSLGANDLKAFLEDIERAWTSDAKRKAKLINPLIDDLERSGALAKVLAAYRRIAEDPSVKPAKATDPDVVRAFKAFDAVYPKPYQMEEVRLYYEANRDLAEDGIYLDLAEVLGQGHKIGLTEVFDKFLLALGVNDSKGKSGLTDIILILDVFARYPRRGQMFEALSKLPDMNLDWNNRTTNDLFDIPLEYFYAFFDQNKKDFESMIDYQAGIVDKGAHKLGPRIFNEMIDLRHGESFANAAYEPLACVLAQETNKPYDRMLKNWAAFIDAYVNDPRRQVITEGVLNFWKNALVDDVLDSTAILANYRDLPALHEAFQVLSRQEVFDKALTDVGHIFSAKDNEGRPVPYTLLIAMDAFFEKDEVHPNQTYMETILDGVDRLLTRDASGRNSLEIVIDAFLDDLTQEQRLKMGEIFKYHTLPDGKKVLAKGREYPSDNIRMLKLLDTAYSPLNCGIPIAMTNVVVPVNLPGIPIKFPTKNLAVSAFEASAHLKASTVERFAGAYDFMVKMAGIGNMFCEPDILTELVADPAPVRALIKTTPLKEMFVMIQELAKRGDAPYLVEMIHSAYLSGASGLFDPTMNAVFEQGVVENFIASLKKVRDTRLPSNPNRKALSVFLDSAQYTLRVPAGRRTRLVRPYLLLFDRILSDDKSRENSQVFFEWVASVLNNPPPGLDLHDLDNVFGEVTGCDKEGKSARAFARLIDDKPDDGDIRQYMPHARTYLDAPPSLAIAFNRMLGRLLKRGAVTESLFLLQRWVELDAKYDHVLQESLGEVLRPNSKDWAPVDPLLYGVLKNASGTIKSEREKIRNILEEQNRPGVRRLMRYPFNAMRKNGATTYMEQSIPAARLMFTKKDPSGKLYLNDAVRGFHALVREGVTISLIGAHDVAWDKGYYNAARDPDVMEAFVDVMNASLRKWQKTAAATPPVAP
ncbi:MAG: hypothetical protein AB1405_00475 [Bdellovibrionota bacterium]